LGLMVNRCPRCVAGVSFRCGHSGPTDETTPVCLSVDSLRASFYFRLWRAAIYAAASKPLSDCRPELIGPLLWGHNGPICHALSLLLLSMLSLWTSILHCHSPGVATVVRRLRYGYSWLRLILVAVSTVATPGEWQCKIRTGGVRQLAVANGPNIFRMLLVGNTAV